MSPRKRRRQWSPAQKLRIVLETLRSEGTLVEIRRREGLAPNLVYHWRKQPLASAEVVFTPKRKRGPDPPCLLGGRA